LLRADRDFLFVVAAVGVALGTLEFLTDHVGAPAAAGSRHRPGASPGARLATPDMPSITEGALWRACPWAGSTAGSQESITAPPAEYTAPAGGCTDG
jgi:hypothetical protein